ncbi:MAG: MBL fold metallo-hydrolase [Spirochaetia bacterium]|nr:MBL fold metallo-hydrolase [Spirochaetia bacterium]
MQLAYKKDFVVKDSDTEGGISYEEPIELAEGIFWVGYVDRERNLHCNPYLIVEGDEAVLIDGGSRPEFSIVMLKILQTGILPQNIFRLIYQHYDPDLCSSIPNFEEIINSNNLKIISHRENNVFIRYYGNSSPLLDINALSSRFTFATGRELSFIHTPYAHSAGSFMTYDSQTKTLFSSDLFGSYDVHWELFLKLPSECHSCDHIQAECDQFKRYCPLYGIYNFHRRIMTSGKALSYAMGKTKQLAISRIAPQHGSILNQTEDIDLVINALDKLPAVGIDAYEP